MTSLLPVVIRLGWLAILASVLLLISGGCAATSELPPPTAADRIIEAADLPSVGKLVVRGNLTIQQGQGNTVADNRKAGQKQGSAATAPAAQASNVSKKSNGPAWYVYLGVACAGALIWGLVSKRLSSLSWFRSVT